MADFLHGSETVQTTVGSRSVTVVKSSVIALTGIAPTETGQNEITLVTNKRDAAQFGKQVPNFTIPQALSDILASGDTTVLVVNVFDIDTHTATETAEAQTVANASLKLDYAPIGAVSVFLTDGSTPVTAVLGTDYTIDEFGNFKVLTNHAELANGEDLKFTYKRLDPSTVTTSHIIGTYDSGTDARTGMEAFDNAYSLHGFNGKIFIAPGYSTNTSVVTAMLSKAEKFRGHAFIDAPMTTTKTVAIAGRGPAGTINFNTSNKRANLFYPAVKGYIPSTDATGLRWYSSYAAGVRAKVTREEGYWVSMSNHLLPVEGMEFPLTSAINDATTDTNQLNAAGIITIFNSFGTGLKIWGNRNASFPSETGPETFESVVTTRDVIEESIELAMLPFIDKPITQGIIDSIIETVNSFLRRLQSQGAILGGECTFDLSKNSVEDIADGKLVFDVTFMPPTPAERITFNTALDITLLQNIAPQQ